MFNLTDILSYLKVPGVAAKLERAGDLLQYVLPWVALSFVAFTGDKNLAWIWFHGCLASTVIVHLIKKASNFTPWGKRPSGGDNSFPSGHTAGAFSGAAFFYFAFGPVWAAVPVALAVLTGVSRVVAGHHWIRDVVGGAVIASVVMWMAFNGPEYAEPVLQMLNF